jgi:hypothetical protein
MSLSKSDNQTAEKHSSDPGYTWDEYLGTYVHKTANIDIWSASVFSYTITLAIEADFQKDIADQFSVSLDLVSEWAEGNAVPTRELLLKVSRYVNQKLKEVKI